MVALCQSVENVAEREEAVRVAEDTLRQVSAIPIAYLQGFSSPLVSQICFLRPLERIAGVDRSSHCRADPPPRRNLQAALPRHGARPHSRPLRPHPPASVRAALPSPAFCEWCLSAHSHSICLYRIDMTTLVGRLQSRLTYTIDVTQRFTSQIQRMDEAQAIASSCPTSPRPPPSAFPSEPVGHPETVNSAALGFPVPAGGLEVPPWEAECS